MKVVSYKDLRVWQAAMRLAEQCYHLSASFPRSEELGLKSQLRRSATSVAANIAEGHGRWTTGDLLRSLRIAAGSLRETETHLHLATRVGLVAEEIAAPALEAADAIGAMLWRLRRQLEANERRPIPTCGAQSAEPGVTATGSTPAPTGRASGTRTRR